MSCNYLNSIPTSPNVNLTLDKDESYTAPLASDINYSVEHTYDPNQGVDFVFPQTYEPPLGGSVNFYLTCNDQTPAIIYVFGEITLEPLIVSSEIFVTVICSGENVLDSIGADSVIARGNWVRSNARIKTPIVSEGYANMIPSVMSAVNDIGNMTIASQSGPIIACVFELGQNISFTDSISHLRGRVIFGYPQANIIREVYEMSNNRSLVIPNVPEDPAYAVFLATTDFNLTDEELKRGTVDMAFTFDHDVKDIAKVSVWIQTPSGSVHLDRMQIIDYPGGQTEPHILLNPFKYSSVFRIPIHCISKKENQFYIEIEYKNAEFNELNNRSRTMLEKENYVVPFQAHFDNRVPYLNIADHAMCDGSEASSNVMFSENSEFIGRAYCAENDLNGKLGQGGNPNSFFTQEFVVITQIFQVSEDINIAGEGANNNTYFIQEYVDLSSGQIGG